MSADQYPTFTDGAEIWSFRVAGATIVDGQQAGLAVTQTCTATVAHAPGGTKTGGTGQRDHPNFDGGR